MKFLDAIATILVLLAGLNWGMVGVADFNVFMWILIGFPTIQRTLYICMGAAALWKIIRYKGMPTR